MVLCELNTLGLVLRKNVEFGIPDHAFVLCADSVEVMIGRCVVLQWTLDVSPLFLSVVVLFSLLGGIQCCDCP